MLEYLRLQYDLSEGFAIGTCLSLIAYIIMSYFSHRQYKNGNSAFSRYAPSAALIAFALILIVTTVTVPKEAVPPPGCQPQNAGAYHRRSWGMFFCVAHDLQRVCRAHGLCSP